MTVLRDWTRTPCRTRRLKRVLVGAFRRSVQFRCTHDAPCVGGVRAAATPMSGGRHGVGPRLKERVHAVRMSLIVIGRHSCQRLDAVLAGWWLLRSLRASRSPIGTGLLLATGQPAP